MVIEKTSLTQLLVIFGPGPGPIWVIFFEQIIILLKDVGFSQQLQILAFEIRFCFIEAITIMLDVFPRGG